MRTSGCRLTGRSRSSPWGAAKRKPVGVVKVQEIGFRIKPETVFDLQSSTSTLLHLFGGEHAISSSDLPFVQSGLENQ